jgi:hypothetical protein
LLVLFWGFFGLFSVFATGEPEFKWAATSLVAAAALSGRLLWALWRRRTLYGALTCLPLAYIAACGIWVANASHNCYYDPLISPARSEILRHRQAQMMYVVLRPDYDFAAVASGPLPRLRYTRYYLGCYTAAAAAASEGKLAPELFELLVQRAAAIDPNHRDVEQLMRLLRQRRGEAEG